MIYHRYSKQKTLRMSLSVARDGKYRQKIFEAKKMTNEKITQGTKYKVLVQQNPSTIIKFLFWSSYTFEVDTDIDQKGTYRKC